MSAAGGWVPRTLFLDLFHAGSGLVGHQRFLSKKSSTEYTFSVELFKYFLLDTQPVIRSSGLKSVMIPDSVPASVSLLGTSFTYNRKAIKPAVTITR